MKTAISFFIRLALALLLVAGIRAASAATQIVGYVTITNTPAGLTSNLVVNIGAADARNWTNSAAGAPATSIQITNSTAASATNLVAHLSAYPVYSAGSGTPQLLATLNSTNTSVVNLYAPENTNLTVSFGGLWARVVYVTNTYADGVPISNRTNSMSSTARTNAENSIVNLLAANRATNALPLATLALRNYTDTNTAQTLGNKTLIGPVLSGGRFTTVTNLTGTNVALTNVTLALASVTNGTIDYVRITNAIGINGTVTRLTNGYWTNGVFDVPNTTNLVNYGKAIRSEGTGGNSFQAGSNALASGSLSMAIGNSSVADSANALAVGIGATATNASAVIVGKGARSTGLGQGAVVIGENSIGDVESVSIGVGTEAGTAGIAIGAAAITQATNAVAVGAASGATKDTSSAFGYAATSAFTNSTAVGASATTTAAYQVRLGTSTETVSIPGMLQAASQTNSVLRGTNTLNGRLDLVPRANSALANGYNSDVVLGTNVYLRLSGPSAAWTNVGFRAASAVDGTFHIVQADNPGLSFTILDNSGLDATAANRILTGTGALKNSTNNPVVFKVIYDGSASRWRVFDWPPN